VFHGPKNVVIIKEIVILMGIVVFVMIWNIFGQVNFVRHGMLVLNYHQDNIVLPAQEMLIVVILELVVLMVYVVNVMTHLIVFHQKGVQFGIKTHRISSPQLVHRTPWAIVHKLEFVIQQQDPVNVGILNITGVLKGVQHGILDQN
jgi:hypothetical protein